MAEGSVVATANRPADPEQLNLAVIDKAQQIVGLTNQLRANQGQGPLESFGGVEPTYAVMFSTGDPNLPAIVLDTAGHGYDQTGDMQSAHAVSWRVSAHMPKTVGVSSRERQVHVPRADQTIAVTAAATHTKVPSVDVHEPWIDSLPEREQLKEHNRRYAGEAPTLADYALYSRTSAIGVLQQNAARGKYTVPEGEAATDEALRDIISDPSIMPGARGWFQDNVAGPVQARLALAQALETMSGIHNGNNPADTVERAIAIQNIITAPGVEQRLMIPQEENVFK